MRPRRGALRRGAGQGRKEGNQNPKQGEPLAAFLSPSLIPSPPHPPTPGPTGAAGNPGGAERGRPLRREAQRVPETGVPSALLSNWVFALCPLFLLGLASPTPLTPLLNPRRPGASLSAHVGRARMAQACSRRPLNASSPKTPRSKRSSSRTLPRIGKRWPTASSSRGSILAPMVRPGAKRRLRAGHPPPGLGASGEA